MRHVTNGFTSLPKEDFFFVLKNPTASAGFEPANLGTKGQHATSRPPKPLVLCVNPLSVELNPIRHLLALVGAQHIVHVSRIRVKYDTPPNSMEKSLMRSWYFLRSSEITLVLKILISWVKPTFRVFNIYILYSIFGMNFVRLSTDGSYMLSNIVMSFLSPSVQHLEVDKSRSISQPNLSPFTVITVLCVDRFNLLATEFFQILAHPVFKMWVIQKPSKVALWNKRHFEEKKMEIIQHV